MDTTLNRFVSCSFISFGMISRNLSKVTTFWSHIIYMACRVCWQIEAHVSFFLWINEKGQHLGYLLSLYLSRHETGISIFAWQLFSTCKSALCCIYTCNFRTEFSAVCLHQDRHNWEDGPLQHLNQLLLNYNDEVSVLRCSAADCSSSLHPWGECLTFPRHQSLSFSVEFLIQIGNPPAWFQRERPLQQENGAKRDQASEIPTIIKKAYTVFLGKCNLLFFFALNFQQK